MRSLPSTAGGAGSPANVLDLRAVLASRRAAWRGGLAYPLRASLGKVSLSLGRSVFMREMHNEPNPKWMRCRGCSARVSFCAASMRSVARWPRDRVARRAPGRKCQLSICTGTRPSRAAMRPAAIELESAVPKSAKPALGKAGFAAYPVFWGRGGWGRPSPRFLEPLHRDGASGSFSKGFGRLF